MVRFKIFKSPLTGQGPLCPERIWGRCLLQDLDNLVPFLISEQNSEKADFYPF